MSPYEEISLMPPDPVFGVNDAYQADPRPHKLTLVTGYFRDVEGHVPLMRAVSQVEAQIADARLTRTYLPIVGDPTFIDLIAQLAFGQHYDSDIVAGFQTVGGTGALCLVGKLIAQFTDQIALSNYTWANHWNIFRGAGLRTHSYPYYRDKQLLFDQMLTALDQLGRGSALLLHACGHNPTGLDLSIDQWNALAEIVKKRDLYPIIDMAYQGFCGQPDEDAYGLRLFVEQGIECALTYTCSKNFSLYGERAGALYFIGHSRAALEKVRSQIKVMIRQMYSEPPTHAAEVVKQILGDAGHRAQWLAELGQMRKRMVQARQDFVSLISSKDPDGRWEALGAGAGLFLMTELSGEATDRLREEKGIFATVGGRVNVTGLNTANLEWVVDAVLDVR